MQPPLESRRDLKQAAENRQQDLTKRLKRMGFTVEDKGCVCDLAKKLHLGTTAEGAETISRHIRDASEASVRKYNELNTYFETQAKSCSLAAQDLYKRSLAARANAELTGTAAAGVRETTRAKADLARGQRDAAKDAGFLGGMSQREDASLRELLKNRDKQREILENMNLGEVSAAVASIQGKDHSDYGISDVVGEQYKQQLDNMELTADGQILELPPEELEARLGNMPVPESEPDSAEAERRKEYLKTRRGYIRRVETYKDRGYGHEE